MKNVRLINITHMNYSECLDFMRNAVQAKINAFETGDHWPDILIMVEHQPVFTLGRRGQMSDIVVPESVLKENGIEVHRIERGGLITYHGPGQLVVYPVFNIKAMGIGVSELVHKMEDVMIAALKEFDVEAAVREGYPGVWIGMEKIASIGLAVRKGVTFHGLALNYDPILSHFAYINPCGLSGVSMTSIKKITGAQVDSDVLRSAMSRHFACELDLNIIPWTLDEAREQASLYVPQPAKAAMA